MSNISFDNPWLLFLLLPVFAAVLIPFFVTVRKDNVNAHNVTAAVLHLLIGVCLTFAISGMTYERVITETNVYVLADVSDSAQHNIDDVQASVEDVAAKLPRNSKMSVICFGRNYQLISDMGDRVPNVKSADKIDRSATDIGAALRYAGNLFEDDVIKRIIVITDGVETVSSNNLVKVVNALQNDGVCVDAVYLDDNLPSDTKEVQIESVHALQSTYLGKENEVEVLLRANCGVSNGAAERTNAYLSLYQNEKLLEKKSVALYNGLNAATFSAPTDAVGTFSYEVKVKTEHESDDTLSVNNTARFMQEIVDTRKVLFIGASSEDVAAGRKIYGTDDADYITDAKKIPYSIEELCVYDEIALCNFDVRTHPVSSVFVSNLNTLVNDYGKSLTTYGNTFIQTLQEDGADEEGGILPKSSPLNALSDLLPVKIGNDEQNGRLFTIVLDVSLSMRSTMNNFEIAKKVAKNYVDALSKKDHIMVLAFSDAVYEIVAPPVALQSKTAIKKAIDACEGSGDVTTLGGALNAAYQKLSEPRYKKYFDKRVLLISDGVSYGESSDAVEIAKNMSKSGIAVSAVGTHAKQTGGDALLSSIVNNTFAQSGASYLSIENENDVDFIIDEIKEETQKVEISGDSYAIKLRANDEVTDGVASVGAIGGFWFNAVKDTQVTTVLSAVYYTDAITTVDVPVYAYWNKGKGKVASFLSDISASSGWTDGWTNGTGGAKFLSNIPKAMLPDEHTVSPFLVEVEGSAVSTRINVLAPSTLNSAAFSVTLVDPDGMSTSKSLAYDSNSYFASFGTDAPGEYIFRVQYDYKDAHYEAETRYYVTFYAEYDSFTTYSKSRLYRITTENGSILDLENTDKIKNSDSAHISYVFSFTVPLVVLAAALFIAEIILRQLKWKDVTSFFKGLFRRKS